MHINDDDRNISRRVAHNHVSGRLYELEILHPLLDKKTKRDLNKALKAIELPPGFILGATSVGSLTFNGMEDIPIKSLESLAKQMLAVCNDYNRDCRARITNWKENLYVLDLSLFCESKTKTSNELQKHIDNFVFNFSVQHGAAVISGSATSQAYGNIHCGYRLTTISGSREEATELKKSWRACCPKEVSVERNPSFLARVCPVFNVVFRGHSRDVLEQNLRKEFTYTVKAPVIKV